MAIPTGFKLAEPEQLQAAIDAPSNIPSGFRLASPTEEPKTDLLGQAQEVLSAVGSNLAELAAGLNRATAAVVDTFGIDNANTILRLVGSETQIPRAAELTVPKGTFTEPGLTQDIVAGIGEVLPAAAGIGAAGRAISTGIPAIAESLTAQTGAGIIPTLSRGAGKVAEKIGGIISPIFGGGTVATDIAGAGLSGAGAVVGKEVIGGPEGELIGAVVAPAGLAIPGLAKTSIKNIMNFIRANPAANEQAILDAGREQGVRILTTDVVPPDSFLGRWARDMSEKLGVLGTGGARIKQQVARQNVVEEITKDFNVDLDSEFAGTIVKSLNKTAARKMERSNIVRNEAVDTLNQFGHVPTDKTREAIEKALTKQSRLGARSDETFVKSLDDTREAVDGAADFSVLKEIRTDVIDDLLAVARGEDFRKTGALQSIKSGIDKDMARFANRAGPDGREAGVKWRAANRNMAEELRLAKDTELRRIFKLGEANPKQALNILLSGNRTQLTRLNKAIGPNGRDAARGAIIQDALQKSGFQSAQGVADINPDRFTNALKSPKTQQAIDVFFKGDDKKRLIGITKLLDATRRAQQFAVTTPTGQTVLPFAAGGLAGSAGAFLALATGGSLSIVAKSYESKAMRTLLLKLANTRNGSQEEQRILSEIVPGILSGIQNIQQSPEQRQ